MNKIFFLFLVSLNILLAIPTKQEINTLVEEIKPARVGLSNQILKVIKDPFIMPKGTSKKKVRRSYARTHSYTPRRVHFTLYATLNKSAKINHKWIMINQTINHYTLKEINKLYVVMQKGTSKPIKVYLNSKNKKINLMTK